MKRWMVVALVLALALTLVPLAMAGGGGAGAGGTGHGKNKFNLVGTVSAVDATTGALVVKVKSGTRTVKAYRGADLALTLASGARVRLVVGDECVPATLADMADGVKVKVRGRIDRTDPTAPVFVAFDVKAKAPAAAAVTPEPTPTPEPTEPAEE